MTRAEVITRTVELIRLKHMARSTEKTYSHWIGAYCDHLLAEKRSGTAAQKVENYLSSMARAGCSASTQNQAFAALLFLHRSVLGVELGNVNALRAKRPQFIKHIPSKTDVLAMLAAIVDQSGYRTRLIVHMIYGCGLRVSEPLNLRVKDVDFDNSRLVIREPKHGHDRFVALPCALADAVRQQLERARSAHADHVREGIPVALPGRLHKKYPRAGFDEGWAWLFPAHRPCFDERTGLTVYFRCLEQTVQRAVRQAARKAGISGIITPHHLRHAYATHLAQSGACLRDIQVAMGHRSLDTTMGYIAPESARVGSPIDGLSIALSV